MKNTKLRLSSTRNTTREAKERLNLLEKKVSEVEDERDSLLDCIEDATEDASKENKTKKETLRDKLLEQSEYNITIERHLQHILHSSGLKKERSDILLSNLSEFFHDNNREIEKLSLSIANTTKLYNHDLKSYRSHLLKNGAPINEVDKINALTENER